MSKLTRGWMPIDDTAKTGNPILVTRYPATTTPPISCVRWCRGTMKGSFNWRIKDQERAVLRYEPTHWRPLPGVERKHFWMMGALLVQALISFWGITSPKQRRGSNQPATKGKVRLHPLPEGASASLASFIGAVTAGAVKDCLNQHFDRLPKDQRGLLTGSIRKRVVNQLTCAEGERELRRVLA